MQNPHSFSKKNIKKVSRLVTLGVLVIVACSSIGIVPAQADGPTSINSCADFENISTGLSGSYLLTADINCTAEANTIMVGGTETPFTGTFNGGGHTITVAISTSADRIGLFGNTSGANISDVRVAGTVSGGAMDWRTYWNRS